LISTPKDLSSSNWIALADIKQNYLISGCTAGLFNAIFTDYLSGVEDSRAIYLQ